MTRAALRISAVDARRLAITAQHLAGPTRRATRAGILEVIRDIGYLQLDPTNVVARNPYLVVWSRVGAYPPMLLDDLLTKHRAIFESPSLILPVSDLALHLARAHAPQTVSGLRRGPSSMDLWRTRREDWLRRNAALRRRVMRRLRSEGPLPLSAFEDRAIVSWTSGDHEDEQNVARLLAILQRRGDVVVAARRRGQKLWAVADGWLPRVRVLSAKARARAATLRALRATGLATVKHLAWYYAFNQHITTSAIASLEREGEIVRLDVAGVPGIFYTASDIARRLRTVRDGWEGRTTLLSPFDNLIHDRARLEALFGYRYRIEIYTPAHRRRLGFWAMPILHGDRIIGSVDPRLDREAGALVVNKLVIERGASAAARRAARAATDDLAAFVGAKRVVWPRVVERQRSD
jgi:uncharacterized protein YcaQ